MPLDILPEEILTTILKFLDPGAPSTTQNFHQPHLELLLPSSPLPQPLKHLSLVSRKYRRLVFPLLFTHLHFELCHLFNPKTPTGPWVRTTACQELLPFARRCLDATGRLPSLVVHTVLDLQAATARIPEDYREINSKLWHMVQDYLNPRRVVVLAPPATLAALMSCPSWMGDMWSFTIPYQRVELHQTSPDSLADRNTWIGKYSGAVDLEGVLPTLFPWSHLSYDEGSSLNNYGSYHYFEKRPPCILSRRALQLTRLGHWLRGVTYTAIFPHLDSFVGALHALGKLPALRHLTLQLVPLPDSLVLSDTAFVSRGNTSMRDCWVETEACYAVAVRALTQTIDGPAHDRGDFSLRALEVFRSADVGTAHVHADLRERFAQLAPDWVEHDATPGLWRNPLPRIAPAESRVP